MIGNMQNETNLKLRDRLEEIAAYRKEHGEDAVIPEELKIRVAALADSPTVVTGFGNVCREILGMLHKTGMYTFDLVGINHDGSPHMFPYRIWPAVNPLMGDMSYREVFGRQKFLDMLGSGTYDIVWVLQDTFVVSEMGELIKGTNDSLPADKKFTFIYYYPVDADLEKTWVDKSVMMADLPVVYTKYGHAQSLYVYRVGEESLLKEEEKGEYSKAYEALEGRLNVIYHGVNPETFYPMPEEDIQNLRKAMWGDKHKDKFIFLNVNRNQPRKDLYRTLLAFKKLLDRRRAKGKDDVYLYTHCSIVDTGLNMVDMSKQIGLTQGDEWAFPKPEVFGVSKGMPIEIVNQFYNASDAVITTTLGEGWGLSITEAMATKRPVIAPMHTSITEMLGRIGDSTKAERGILVKTNGVFVQHDDNSRVRPVTDVDDLVDKMEELVENRAQYQPMVERAYNWVQELKWDGPIVGDKWKKLFESAYVLTLGKRAAAIHAEISQINGEEKPKWLLEKERRKKNGKK